VYVLHSYMTDLCFMTDPPFDCPDEVSDAAFVKATHTIGGWDAVEEYMACKLHPLFLSFNVGEVVDREMPMLKLSVPMSDIPIAGLPEETNG
jgi:hypothetical protein